MGGQSLASLNLGRGPTLQCEVDTLWQITVLVILFTHLFCFGAVKVPATDLVIASEHVHGHHTDGKGDCANDHLPGVGGHQEAVHTEQTSQHGAAELPMNTSRVL